MIVAMRGRSRVNLCRRGPVCTRRSKGADILRINGGAFVRVLEPWRSTQRHQHVEGVPALQGRVGPGKLNFAWTFKQKQFLLQPPASRARRHVCVS